MNAQLVLFDGFDPLDVIAPFEVLAAGSDAVGGELEVELVSAGYRNAGPDQARLRRRARGIRPPSTGTRTRSTRSAGPLPTRT